MHLTYSALNTNIPNQRFQDIEHSEPQNEIAERYQAYWDTCDKYRHEIAAIQKYMPGWMPKFR